MPEVEVYGPVNKIVNSSNAFGSMSPAAIWALVALSLAGYIYWLVKQDKALRSSAIEANAKVADALNKLAQEIAILRVVIQDHYKGDNHV